MSDLQPCPFCGSEAVIKKYFIKGVANHLNYFVACKCEIRTRSRKNIDGATSDWNSRPIEDALRAENERLRKALKEIANHSWYPELNYGVTIFDPHWYEGKYHDFKDIAREALEVKK